MIRLNHSLGCLNPILRCWFKSKFLPSNDGSRVESCKPCGRPNGVWHLTLTWPSPGYCVHLRNQKIRLAGRKLCLQLCSFYPSIHLSISPSTNISLCLSMWMKINSFFFSDKHNSASNDDPRKHHLWAKNWSVHFHTLTQGFGWRSGLVFFAFQYGSILCGVKLIEQATSRQALLHIEIKTLHGFDTGNS